MRVSYLPPPSTVPCHEFEHRFRIIIQPAHEFGVELVLYAARVEDLLQLFEVLATLIAEEIHRFGRVFVDLRANLLLAVEDSQGVFVEAGTAGIAHFGQVRAQIFFQRLVEFGAAVLAADRIEVEFHPLDAECGDIVAREQNDFRIRFGALAAEDLHAELVVFAQSARLRPLIAEHGGEIVHSLASPFSMNERTTPAVPSGFKVMLRSPLSRKVYISLLTMSVVSPTPRRNSSVCSKTGVRISFKLYRAAILRAVSSTKCHL